MSAFFTRQVAKTYNALVLARPEADKGVVDSPVDGYPACSSWSVVETFPPSSLCFASLVEVMPKQGRKHQVRAHLAELSSPILLDPIYTAAGG